ncbi:heterokaryon incompatibility protein het-E-1 [Fusarium tjaetaba]|uniref:Heterokaryon incompatibility protein het-E-1 n=1 Tax=Fusarium tjaetaba TaxID=1567544 RepID=A0A8H5W971_9HYPO|nr:heterokaryon incompatibility protein het-E-1 [Fusarium tjaetaba]KAF5649833.1 heterokaryon incompatibility protein het-E-1 [Fusarium tjaetaba]
MRLINTQTLELHEFFNENTPPYAILSHVWGNQEATFQDWQNHQQVIWKAGYWKIRGACNEALKYRLEWLWVDTNCIDKSSSAELSEAINSMFAYYQKSEVCFAYLVDVPTANQPEDVLYSQIARSRWFTRGWTLQELIAPKNLIFHAADWSQICRNVGSLTFLVTQITQIRQEYLDGQWNIHGASIAERMSWLSKRTTTRTEDMAYCMLGIFNINMPLLYGEGERAFVRLQEEIMKTSNDHTIFCWEWNEDVPKDWGSLLAPWPTTFQAAGDFCPAISHEISIYSMTNAGLSIQLPTMITSISTHRVDNWVVVLQATSRRLGHMPRQVACIRVAGHRIGDLLHVSRIPSLPRPMTISEVRVGQVSTQALIVTRKFRLRGEEGRNNESIPDFDDERILHFLPVFAGHPIRNSQKPKWRFEHLHGEDVGLDSAVGTITLKVDEGGIGVGAIMMEYDDGPSSIVSNLLLGAGLEDDAYNASVEFGGLSSKVTHNTSIQLPSEKRLFRRWSSGSAPNSRDMEGILRQWTQQIRLDRFTRPLVSYSQEFDLTMVLERAIDVMWGSRSCYFLIFYKGHFVQALVP